MATFYAKRRGQSLVPASRASALEMERLPEGVALRVKAVRPRNGGHHRLTWALFTYVADALNSGPVAAAEWRPEDVKDVLLVATGHSRAVRVNGQLAHIPTSTSYEAMDAGEYAKFFDAALRYVRDELCPWIEASDHWPHIRQIIEAAHLGAA